MNRTGLVAVSTAQGDPTIYVWEPMSLTVLAQFQDSSAAARHSLAPYAGGLLAVQDKKTLLHYYKYGTAIGTPHKKSTTTDRLCSVSSWRNLLVAGSSSGAMRLWDSATGELLCTLTAHAAAVTAVAVSESRVLSGSEDGLVREFRLADLYAGVCKPRRTLSHHSMTVTHVKVAGNTVLSASLDHTVAAVDAEELRRWDLGAPANCVEPDNTSVYAGGADGSVYRFGENPAVWKWQSSGVAAIVVLPDSAHLLVAADCVYLLAAATGDRLKTFKMHKGPVAELIVVDRPEALTAVAQTQEVVNPLAKVVDSSVVHKVTIAALPKAAEPTPADETQRAAGSEAARLRSRNEWLYRAWMSGCNS